MKANTLLIPLVCAASGMISGNLRAAANTFTSGTAWATTANWSQNALPTASDNVIINRTASATLGINGSSLSNVVIQDISNTSTASIILENSSGTAGTSPVLVTLNGGRGAGVPLIDSGGANLFTIRNGGTNALGLVLGASGSFNAGAGGLTVSSNITETGGARTLTKIGSGVLILSGTNSFTGGLNISAGTVSVPNGSSLGSGDISLGAVGVGLTISGTSSVITNNIVLSAVSGSINLDTPSNSSTVINGVVSGGGASTVWFFRGGASGQNTGALTLNGLNTLQGTINVQRGPLILGNSAAAGSAIIKLDSNNNPNGSLQFSSSFDITNPVLLQSGATQRIGVSNGQTNGLGGVISSAGAFGIEKVGSGTLVLTAANTFAGGTTVTTGTLVLDYTAGQNNSKLSDSGILNLAGGTLSLKGGTHTEVVASTTVSGASIVNQVTAGSTLQMGVITKAAAGLVDFSADGIATTSSSNVNGILGPWATVAGKDFAMNSTGGANGAITAFTGYTDVPFAGTISDLSTANVRLTGGTSANVVLGATTTSINSLLQNQTTATTIDSTAQTLRLGTTGAILVPAGKGALTVGTTPNAGTITPGGTVTGTAADLALINHSSNALTINSAISDNGAGAVSLVKNGVGTAVIAGTNTFTGTTTISGGTLVISGGASIPDAGTVSIANVPGAGLQLNSNETIGLLTGTGPLGGSINLQSNTLTFGDATTNTIPGVISGVGGKLVKQGAGVLTLSGNNTFTGGMTLADGSLTVVDGNSIGTGPLTITKQTAATLTVANNDATTLTNEIALPAPATAQTYSIIKNTAGISVGTELTLSGVISGGNANTTLFFNSNTASDGTTTYRLSGENTFTGTVNLNRGGIVVTNPSSLGGGGNTLVMNANNNTTLGDLRFTGSMTFPTKINLPNTSNGPINTNGFNVTLSGVISGNGNGTTTGALNKVGAGILTLTGANIYTGATLVNGGTLLVNGSQLSPSTTVNTGAILGGSGGVLSGIVTVNSGGRLAPGASIGTLTTGAVSLNTGSTFASEFDTTNMTADLLNVNGALALTGVVTLNLTDLGANVPLPNNSKFTLISYSGAWNNTVFSGFADDSTFTLGSNQWSINYNDSAPGSNGGSFANNVTLTVVPEPSSIVLFSFGLLTLVRRRRAI